MFFQMGSATHDTLELQDHDFNHAEQNKKLLDFMDHLIQREKSNVHGHDIYGRSWPTKIVFKLQLQNCEPLEFHFDKHQNGFISKQLAEICSALVYRTHIK